MIWNVVIFLVKSSRWSVLHQLFVVMEVFTVYMLYNCVEDLLGLCWEYLQCRSYSYSERVLLGDNNNSDETLIVN